VLRPSRALVPSVLSITLAFAAVVAGGGPRLVATTDGAESAADAETAAGRATAPAMAPASVRQPRAGSSPTADVADPTKVALGLTLVKSGFTAPLLVTGAHDGSNRLFVVEQGGLIRIISGGTTLATPFLDLRGAISSGGERGLLGLAFHPNYPTVPYFYVNFTNVNGNTAIQRYRVSSNPNIADPASAFRILTITQPYSNHNGGNLAFGPDGYLYIGMGDGGGSGDPGNRAQSLNSLLGKMLRIDVDHQSSGKRYRVPTSNPYVGRSGLDEIWSRGLRNPWRWSFDRATGALWIGDVGQNRYEEIDRSLKQGSTPAGRAANYGWPVLEGRACYKPATGCSTTGKYPPLVVYGHSASTANNCSVTGGFVYRGSAYPVLTGVYVFGDFCSGRIWGVGLWAHTPATPTLLRGAGASPQLAISSFGEDDANELYVTDLAGGRIYRVTATPKA
jgi:glucose/arabinose dehydrogenase